MEQSNRSKIYRSMSAQTLITVTLGLLGIVYFSVMSRLLSKEDFGYYAVIMAAISIFASLSEAGLGSAVIQNKSANRHYIQSAWTLSLLLGIFFCILLFISSGLLSRMLLGSEVLKKGYRLMSISLIFYAINGVGRAVIIKNLDFLRYGFFDIIGYTLSALVGVFMAYNGYGFYSVIMAMLLHQIILGILLLTSIRKIIAVRIKKMYIRQIATFGGWLTGSVIVRNITDQLDKLITTKWIPVAGLGEYSRPAGLVFQITGYINGIFDTILFPILSEINDDKNRVNTAYIKSVELIVLFSIVLAALFILGDEILITVFLGEKWLYLSKLFQVVSISIVLLSYDRIADCFFRSLGIVKKYFVARCYSMIFTCLCMFIGCHYGIMGLAFGLVTSRLLCILVKIYILSQHISMNRKKIYKDFIGSWIIPVTVFVLCYILKLFIPFASLISPLLYVLVILVLATYHPNVLGRVFFDNVYVVVKNRIIK